MRDLHAVVGNAELFPSLARWNYFNHAGVSPWPRPTIEAVERFAVQFGLDTFLDEPFFNLVDQCKSLLARLMNAEADEIAIMRNTSDGIATTAAAIDWKAGDRIVVPAPEYPSNVYPWMDAQKRHGAEMVFVPEVQDSSGTAKVSEDALLEAASHERTKVLAISHVQWASGQRMDIDRLGAFCRPRGILFCVDAIQSLGVVPVDVRKSQIDILTSGGHKWLLSPTGAGTLYVRRPLIERLVSPLVGWNSVKNPLDWRIKFDLRADAGRFETGTHAFPCLAGMKPSLELLLEVGIEPIHAHVKALGDRFARGVAEAGYRLICDREAASGVGGAVCFEPRAGQNPDEIVKKLRTRHRIEIAARMGRLRFSPHFYNTHDQAARAVEALRES